MSKPVILVVDDAPEYLSMIGAMLESAYTVRLASSGRRALELAVQRPEPALAILDVLMPEMDGYAVLAALRENPLTSDIPAIFMTSLDDPGAEAVGLALGAVDYIAKPAAPAVLHARIELQIELKRMRSNLHEANERLQQTVADLTAFSYSVTHDLRAPLAAITGFSEALRQDEARSLSPKGLQYLDRIGVASRKMGVMIEDILAYSQTTQSEMRQGPVNPTTIVNEVIGELKPPYPQTEYAVGLLPEVRADAAMLRQVFTNLIGNAFKFSRDVPKARVEIGARSLGNTCELFVRDNGAGFDMAYAGKLFGLFQRLHSQSEFTGTGVGLAVVSRLVARHGGTVRGQSVPGGWTTFTFTLPQALADGAPRRCAAEREAVAGAR